MSDHTSNNKNDSIKEGQFAVSSNSLRTLLRQPSYTKFTPSSGAAKMEPTKEAINKLINSPVASFWKGRTILHPDRITRDDDIIPLSAKYQAKVRVKADTPQKDTGAETDGFIIVDESKIDEFVVVEKPENKKKKLEKVTGSETC